MRIKKIYLANDGAQFDYRIDAERYERRKRSQENYRQRERLRDQRIREKGRISAEKLKVKEDALRNRLMGAFGETIRPAIDIIIQNKRTIKQILTTTTRRMIG